MELAPTVISAGWASGVNAYLTVALLGLLGRAGVGEVPEPLQSDPVMIAALAMYAVEFVVDKIPLLDSTWDLLHTVVRPAIGSAVGLELAGGSGAGTIEEALSGAGGGGMALLSHGIKAGIRLGINTSPEPFSNIFASLVEDGLVAAVIALSLEHPFAAAAIAIVLLVAGVLAVVFLVKQIRRGWRALQARWRGPPA